MLVSTNALEKSHTPNSYALYSKQVDLFTQYLRQIEQVNVAFESAESEAKAEANFNLMPESTRLQKIKNFESYYNHCFEMVAGGESLRDRAKSLSIFKFLYGIQFPSEEEIFNLIEKDVYVEIYDKNFLQLYRSPDWLETTSFGLKTLETTDWRELFTRSEKVLNKQMEVVSGIYSGQVKLPVFRPIEVHTVKELGKVKPYCCEIESILYSPVYDQNNEFVGGLHLLKLHDLRALDFQVLQPNHSL